jgi:hypothetical protein
LETLIANQTIDFDEAPSAYETSYNPARKLIKMWHSLGLGAEVDTEAWGYTALLLRASESTKFCLTEKGYIGLVLMACGLVITSTLFLVVWRHSCCKRVIRVSVTSDFVGECYIHGFMKEEAFESVGFEATDGNHK